MLTYCGDQFTIYTNIELWFAHLKSIVCLMSVIFQCKKKTGIFKCISFWAQVNFSPFSTARNKLPVLCFCVSFFFIVTLESYFVSYVLSLFPMWVNLQLLFCHKQIGDTYFIQWTFTPEWVQVIITTCFFRFPFLVNIIWQREI